MLGGGVREDSGVQGSEAVGTGGWRQRWTYHVTVLEGVCFSLLASKLAVEAKVREVGMVIATEAVAWFAGGLGTEASGQSSRS